MQHKTLITLSAALFTAGFATSCDRTGAGTTGGAATDVRDHQGRGHR